MCIFKDVWHKYLRQFTDELHLAHCAGLINDHLLSFQEVIQHDAVVVTACYCIFAIPAEVYTVDFLGIFTICSSNPETP